MNEKHVIAAQIAEKDAEIEYLKNRNLSLSIAVQQLAEQVRDVTPEQEESPEDDASV